MQRTDEAILRNTMDRVCKGHNIFTISNSGTSDGVKKGWEKRRNGGGFDDAAKTGWNPSVQHKPGDDVRGDVVKHYVEKYGDKMAGSSKAHSKEWVGGTHLATTAAEKDAIWTAIQTNHSFAR